MFTTLRYHETLDDSDNQQDLDADYSLRAASRVLGSDFIYARHRWDFRYTLTRGKSGHYRRPVRGRDYGARAALRTFRTRQQQYPEGLE